MTSAPRKAINLALQGGGAHGAFTWGVLDALLEDGRITFEGISGTSAGAMNALMVADGLARGGPAAARTRLADFWRAISIDGSFTDLQRKTFEGAFSFFPGAPMQGWFDAMSQYFSPYQFNPLNFNPLREALEKFVDFDAVRRNTSLALYVAATNVQTGRLRIFPRDKITLDVVMASACLPLLFQAVKVDGVAYWDGGYLGNPVIFPLFRDTQTEDVLIVQLNPAVRSDIPDDAHEILNRANEITFNSSLMSEYRAIEFVARLIDQGRLPRGTEPGQYRRVNAHRIVLGEGAKTYTADSKMTIDFDFLKVLHDNGRRSAKSFLDQHFDDIGVRSTFDLRAEAQAEWA